MKQVFSFFTAIQFLTRIPCPSFKINNKHVTNSLLYFPLVGGIIGYILVLGQLLMNRVFQSTMTAAMLVGLYVVITGGLHLDGFIDTVDGLFSNRSKDQILDIMKDSRVGAYGVTALIILILIKFSVYQELGKGLPLSALVIVMIANRWGMTFLIITFPYLTKEGLGELYQEHSNKKYFLIGTFVTILLSFLINWQIGCYILAIITITAWLYGKKITAILGGLTGDTYGAFAELSELISLIMLLALYKIK